MNRAQLSDALGDDAAAVRDYGTYKVLTTEGRVLTGLLAKETSDSIHIQQANGEIAILTTDEIEQVSPSAVSTMPTGLGEALNEQELHNLAMNHVGKDLEERGFEFVAINSKLKKHPQFVCIDKNSQYFFVIVRAVMLPDNPNNYDVIWMETAIKRTYFYVKPHI